LGRIGNFHQNIAIKINLMMMSIHFLELGMISQKVGGLICSDLWEHVGLQTWD